MNSNDVANSLIGTKLPQDLVEYIWSFNYFWASNIIQKYTKNYISKKVRNIYNMARFASHMCNLGIGVKKYNLFYHNKVLKNSDILISLNACKCCTKHQINKPNIIEPWVDTEFHGTQDIQCSCPCRHLARFICRAIND